VNNATKANNICHRLTRRPNSHLQWMQLR